MSGGDGFGKGDRVRVSVGPYRDRRGIVKRVLRMPNEPTSAAVVLVEFTGGGESYQVGANLEKLETAEKDGKK